MANAGEGAMSNDCLRSGQECSARAEYLVRFPDPLVEVSWGIPGQERSACAEYLTRVHFGVQPLNLI